MGTIYGDKRFRKNPSLANTPDGQTTIGDIPEMPDRKRSVNDNDEKIRQMISTTRPGEWELFVLMLAKVMQQSFDYLMGNSWLSTVM